MNVTPAILHDTYKVFLYTKDSTMKFSQILEQSHHFQYHENGVKKNIFLWRKLDFFLHKAYQKLYAI